MSELKEVIIDIVNEVPVGAVTSFGAVAKQILKRTKRMISGQMVGWQLSGMPEHERILLPWRRVINQQGYVSSLKLGVKGLKQIGLLEKEGYTIVSGYLQDPQRRDYQETKN